MSLLPLMSSLGSTLRDLHDLEAAGLPARKLSRELADRIRRAVFGLLPVIGRFAAVIVSLLGLRRLSRLDILSTFILSFCLGVSVFVLASVLSSRLQVDLLGLPAHLLALFLFFEFGLIVMPAKLGKVMLPGRDTITASKTPAI
jgi:hypothetical protein